MTDMPQPPPTGESALSLIRDDAFFKMQRAIRLIPRSGFGLRRRILFYVLLTWLPLTIWSIYKHRAWSGEITEPLLAHYSIHTRLLIALPMFIVGEALAHGITMRLVPQFMVA